jgi:hypothetical protein
MNTKALYTAEFTRSSSVPIYINTTDKHTHTEKLHICSYIYTHPMTPYIQASSRAGVQMKWDKINDGVAYNIYNIAVDWLTSISMRYVSSTTHSAAGLSAFALLCNEYN